MKGVLPIEKLGIMSMVQDTVRSIKIENLHYDFDLHVMMTENVLLDNLV